MSISKNKDLIMRLDKHCAEIRGCYEALLVDAKTFDYVPCTGSDLPSELHSKNLVQASKTLLSLISEVKMSAILNDHKARNLSVDNRCKAYAEETKNNQIAILELKQNVGIALNELECHYYGSRYR